CAGSFFFHAADGIRDATVTGVQTCALPIYIAACVSAPRQYRREPAKIPPRCAPNLQLRKQLADPRRAAVRLNRDSTGSGVSARSAARQKIPTCAPESATLPGARPDWKSRPGDACARKK